MIGRDNVEMCNVEMHAVQVDRCVSRSTGMEGGPRMSMAAVLNARGVLEACNGMNEALIPITRFRDECDHATRGHDQRDVLTWNQLTAVLTNHARRVAKSGPGWAPVTFVDAPCTCGSPKCPGDRGHRVNENVIALHALTLDVDKTTAVKASERRQLDRADAEQALTRLCELGLRHVGHTTHSHAYPDHASFRVTIALSRSVSAEEWPRFYTAALAYLDIPHDPASRNTARFWYLPSCKPDAAPIVVVHEGQPLDVEMVMGISRAAAVAAARTAAKKPAATRRYVAKRGDLDIRALMAERYAAVCAEPGRADVEAQWHIGLTCPWKDEHTSPDVATATTVFLYKSGAWTFKCLHSHCEGRNDRDFHKFHDPSWVPFDERPAPARRATRREPPLVLDSHRDPSQDVETDAEVAAIRAEQLGNLAGADLPTSPTPLPPPPFPPTDDDLELAHRRAPAQDAPPTDGVPPPGDGDVPGGRPKREPRYAGGESAVSIAADYVSRFATHSDGPTLRRWRGDWYRWTPEAGRYVPCTDERIEANLYRDLGLTRPADVRDVRAALIGVDGVLIDEVELGGWIGEPVVDHPPLEIAACPNGLLHLPSRTLSPATPRYFATTALGARYDPAAPAPTRWLAFLSDLWGDDGQSIAALQEWLGYLLTPDTRQQKMMLLVGPKRSGKGTTGRILKALLGEDSVAAPTLASLGTNFGLWPLIGRIAAIIGDARLGGRSDIAQIVERLLSISGQDAQTIDRKHREPWTGYLSARMTIVSNELPRFTDASDALASRMLILELEHSFYGREDTGLTDALLAELPGILRWAIDGWDRLRHRGHFVQPATSAALRDELEELASPVAAWVRDRCAKGRALSVPVPAAFRDYQRWATEEGHQHRATLTTFGRDLKAAAQVKRKQISGGGRVYEGIELKPEPESWRKESTSNSYTSRRDVYS